MQIRQEQFDKMISVGLRNNNMQEPLINWYGELYVKYNIAGNQLTLFKLVQALNLVKEHSNLVEEINSLNEMERSLLIAKATTSKFEKASDEDIIKRFGCEEKFRVAYAMGIIDRDSSDSAKWFYDLSEKDKLELFTLAEQVSEDLRKV